MIRHTIFFKIKPGISRQVLENAFDDFLALQHKLPGIITMMGGECSLHENKGNNLFSHAFSIDFKNRNALDSFLKDSITHPAKDGILNIVQGGYDGLIGFDLEN